MEFDQVECARAWAKVLAYRRCGKEAEARMWWERLCALLGYASSAREVRP